MVFKFHIVIKRDNCKYIDVDYHVDTISQAIRLLQYDVDNGNV